MQVLIVAAAITFLTHSQFHRGPLFTRRKGKEKKRLDESLLQKGKSPPFLLSAIIGFSPLLLSAIGSSDGLLSPSFFGTQQEGPYGGSWRRARLEGPKPNNKWVSFLWRRDPSKAKGLKNPSVATTGLSVLPSSVSTYPQLLKTATVAQPFKAAKVLDATIQTLQHKG